MHPEFAQYQRSFVLLSGGIDSSTCLSIANQTHKAIGGEVEAISINYGQRHKKEIECAKEVANYYRVEHTVLDMDFAGDCMLTNKDTEVPNISYDQIKGVSPTYVPFRNGMMLSRLAAYAQSYVNKISKQLEHTDGPEGRLLKPNLEDLCTIYFGAHAEDAKNWAYPDCTPEFIGSMAAAIYIGTYRTVRLQAPLTYASKAQTVAWGKALNTPYHLTWSCYKGEELHCGICPTCRARKEAFKTAGVIDPTEYADIKDSKTEESDMPY